MARDKLLIPEAKESDLGACHRLKSDSDDSGIIARFVDLDTRDKWLSSAKNLSKLKLPKDKSISISVDLPPCLREVKKQLAMKRKDLKPEFKRRSYIKHMPKWPYLELKYKVTDDNTRSIQHEFSKNDVARAALAKSNNLKEILFELPAGLPAAD